MSSQQKVETYGTGRKTLKSYMTGLVLSLIFTFTAFYLVGQHTLSTTALYVSLSLLAVMQLLAQVIFFLCLTNKTAEGRWNTMPFIFVIAIILLLVGGTLWIMYNLNYHMVH